MTEHTQPFLMLPSPPTPCLGREHEVAELAALLAVPEHRLVTLLGPGGIGKTRLAIALAMAQQAQFRDGVCFVDLQPVVSVAGIATAIAAALGLPLIGAAALEAQLLDAIHDHALLLVLDSAEHLVNGAALLASMLQAAPHIKLLVTSRHVLNLRAEWVYVLEGLAVPPADAGAEAALYPAVRLFVERARQVHPRFALSDEQDEVIRICRLVEGMPLALELAAAWTRTLPCAAIAAEIARNLDFLAGSMRDVPARHRSVRAAFDQCWPLLGADEQACFTRLAVFRGSFSREAAEQVAGMPLAALMALVDASLIQRSADGRYHIHELLRQYADERLHESPQAAASAHDAHQRYYTDLLDTWLAALLGAEQRAANARMALEIENIRAAWSHAVVHGRTEAIRRALVPLSLFYQYRGPYPEGIALLTDALRAAREADSDGADDLLAALLVELAWLHMKVGHHAAAKTALDEGRAIMVRRGIAPPRGRGTDPRLGLGVLALVEGAYAAAATLAEAALRQSQQQPQPWNRAVAWWVLANATRAQGQIAAAQHAIEQAYAHAQANGDHWFLAYCRNELGSVATAHGAYGEAVQHFAFSYELRAAFDDREGMALALALVGHTLLLQGDALRAREQLDRSIALYRHIGDRGGLAAALASYGSALSDTDRTAAQRCFSEALQLAAGIGYVPLVLKILTGLAELALQTDRTAQAVALLRLVLRHPASDWETQTRARQLLAPVGRGRDTADQHPNDPSADLAAVIIQLQTELGLPITSPQTHLVRPPIPTHGDATTTSEPLTERERAILALLAGGYSNRAIAERLILSVGTVRWYTSQIYAKLGVQTRTQASLRARDLNLLP